MTDYISSIFWGVLIGCIHGFVLWQGIQPGLALASFMLFDRNVYFVAFLLVSIVDTVSLITVLSSGYWMPKLMKFREEFIAAENIRLGVAPAPENDEDFEEEIPCSAVLTK